MKINYNLTFIFLLLFSFRLDAQDSLYTREIISKLTSEKFAGRGYVNNGDYKAALFLEKEFGKIGLEKNSLNYFQPFSFPVNTFPSKMEVKINQRKLRPGIDFIIDPSSSGLKGVFKIKHITHSPSYYKNEDLKNYILLIDTNETSFPRDSLRLWSSNPLNVVGIIFIKEKKLTWGVSKNANSFFTMHVLRNGLPNFPLTISINVFNKFIVEHQTQNVIGVIPGTLYPDSFIFITAHYDHLGKMGSKTYFPGANDNASGVSMLLNLAYYFNNVKDKLKYSIVFIAFAGEEAGLVGSEFYTKNPTIDLKKINFLINLDLLGTGDDGLMIVNGSIYNEAYETFDILNRKNNYLKTIEKRGKAQNSDHYYFTEKGVPSFFCYTLGGITAYHDIFDKEKTLPLTKYKEVFHLLADFISSR